MPLNKERKFILPPFVNLSFFTLLQCVGRIFLRYFGSLVLFV